MSKTISKVSITDFIDSKDGSLMYRANSWDNLGRNSTQTMYSYNEAVAWCKVQQSKIDGERIDV